MLIFFHSTYSIRMIRFMFRGDRVAAAAIFWIGKGRCTFRHHVRALAEFCDSCYRPLFTHSFIHFVVQPKMPIQCKLEASFVSAVRTVSVFHNIIKNARIKIVIYSITFLEFFTIICESWNWFRTVNVGRYQRKLEMILLPWNSCLMHRLISRRFCE